MKREAVNPIHENVVNPADVDIVVRDGVARTRKSHDATELTAKPADAGLETKKKSRLRSRKSLSEMPEDEVVVKGMLGTMEAMQLEQKRDAIDALMRQRDALKKKDPAARSVAGIQCAQSMVVDVADDFHHCVKEVKRGARAAGSAARGVSCSAPRTARRSRRASWR